MQVALRLGSRLQTGKIVRVRPAPRRDVVLRGMKDRLDGWRRVGSGERHWHDLHVLRAAAIARAEELMTHRFPIHTEFAPEQFGN